MFTPCLKRTFSARPEILLVLAALLGFLMSATLGGNTVPRLLPTQLQDAASPIDAIVDTAVLERAIEAHDAGRLDEAIEAWQRVTLPAESQVWQHVGLGVGYLQAGQIAEAADELVLAKQQAPDNAAVHYFLGLLKMEQAATAAEFADAVHLTGTQWVSYTDSSSAATDGKTRSRYEAEAIQELELAIKCADGLDLHKPLVPVGHVVVVPYPLSEPMIAPTVEELLYALGADNFVGKAHGLLVHLYLERDHPSQAEHHLDAAVLQGIAVPYGYRLVGERFEAQGRSTDAHRAFLKAMQAGDGLVEPDITSWQNQGTAFAELF